MAIKDEMRAMREGKGGVEFYDSSPASRADIQEFQYRMLLTAQDVLDFQRRVMIRTAIFTTALVAALVLIDKCT